MSATILNLLLNLIAGALCGNVAGSAAGKRALGSGRATIVGACGGVAGGSLLTSLIPILAGAGSDGVDVGVYLT